MDLIHTQKDGCSGGTKLPLFLEAFYQPRHPRLQTPGTNSSSICSLSFACFLLIILYKTQEKSSAFRTPVEEDHKLQNISEMY